MSHAHGSAAAANRGRLVAVFGISAFVFAVELVGGLVSNSLALLADAGHALTDLAGVGLSLLAIWFAARPASGARTFGYLRLEILAAVVIAIEAWSRLANPPEIASGLMLAIALVGLGANAVSLYLLRDAQRGSLNMRGAYLEAMGDFAGSAAVIGAALVIAGTGWIWVDAVASVLIALLIVPRAWRLLREAVDVLLEASPKGVDLDDVRSHILGVGGVADVHDLHAWMITSGMNVLSAHVVLDENASPAVVLEELCSCLSGDYDIEHSTFQLETSDRRRLEQSHHA